MSGHETDQLGAYALGVLDDDEWAAVHSHVEGCPQCRREVADLRDMEAMLGEVPPEAFLEGPPPGGGLLLQRTLRQVRDQGRGRDRRRRATAAVAAAVIAAVAIGGGVLLGRSTAPAGQRVTALPSAPAASAPAPRLAAATDFATGASMNVEVRPAAGWVRVRATVAGVPAGEQCRLYVLSRGGGRELAGSWLVSESGASAGTTVEGSAIVAPDDVSGVQVETYAGNALVTVPI